MFIDFELLGKIFKEAREKNKLTLEEVGREINHSPKWVTRLENGEIDIRIDILFNLCTLYSLDLARVIRKVELHPSQKEIEEYTEELKAKREERKANKISNKKTTKSSKK